MDHGSLLVLLLTHAGAGAVAFAAAVLVQLLVLLLVRAGAMQAAQPHRCLARGQRTPRALPTCAASPWGSGPPARAPRPMAPDGLPGPPLPECERAVCEPAPPTTSPRAMQSSRRGWWRREALDWRLRRRIIAQGWCRERARHSSTVWLPYRASKVLARLGFACAPRTQAPHARP